MKDSPTKQTLKSAVTIALKSTSDEKAFKKQLAEQGINVVVRRNDIGRIYGITFHKNGLPNEDVISHSVICQGMYPRVFSDSHP